MMQGMKMSFRPSEVVVDDEAVEWIRELKSFLNDTRKYGLAIEFAQENKEEFEEYLREKEQEEA